MGAGPVSGVCGSGGGLEGPGGRGALGQPGGGPAGEAGPVSGICK